MAANAVAVEVHSGRRCRRDPRCSRSWARTRCLRARRAPAARTPRLVGEQFLAKVIPNPTPPSRASRAGAGRLASDHRALGRDHTSRTGARVGAVGRDRRGRFPCPSRRRSTGRESAPPGRAIPVRCDRCAHGERSRACTAPLACEGHPTPQRAVTVGVSTGSH